MAPRRWDRYLGVDQSAPTPAEVEGLRLFTNVGCMTCHTGELPSAYIERPALPPSTPTTPAPAP